MFVTLVYLEMLKKSDTSQRDAVNVWQLSFSFFKKNNLVVLVDVPVNIMEQSFFPFIFYKLKAFTGDFIRYTCLAAC